MSVNDEYCVQLVPQEHNCVLYPKTDGCAYSQLERDDIFHNTAATHLP